MYVSIKIIKSKSYEEGTSLEVTHSVIMKSVKWGVIANAICGTAFGILYLLGIINVSL